MTVGDDEWVQRELAATRKSIEDTRLFIAEQQRLMAEVQREERERWWLPYAVLVANAVIAALIGVVAAKLL